MADAIIVAPKRRRGLRILGWTGLVLALLVIISYFVVTSSAFFTGVILPRVSASMHAKITVGQASISPFSQVDLHQVKIETTGAEPLLQAGEVKVVYHLMDIIGGNYHVEEVTVTSPVLAIVRNADGTSNLDPLFQQSKATPSQPAQPGKAAGPLRIDIKKIALNNATIRISESKKDGSSAATELANVNITLDDLKNGQTGKLTLAVDIKMDNRMTAPGASSLLAAKASGTFALSLPQDLKTPGVSGSAQIDVQKAEGAMNGLGGLSAAFDCDVVPTEIKQVALRFQRGGKGLGLIRASGPFDMAKNEGRINVEITAIDREVLNLAGARSGIDFGSTSVSLTNQIDLANGGSVISLVGQLGVVNMAVKKAELTTPTVDLRAGYNITVNRAENSAILRTLTLDGTQNRQPFLHAELTSPMSFSSGSSGNGAGDSALKVTVTRMNLADWKSLLGKTASDGVLNLTANLKSQQSGGNLAFDVTSTIEGLAAEFGSDHLNHADVSLKTRGQAVDLNKVDLTEFNFALTQQGHPMLSASVSGQCELKTQQADLQVAVDAALPQLFQALSRPDAAAVSGGVHLGGRLTNKDKSQIVTGNLVVTNFSGGYGEYHFDDFEVNADLDVVMGDQQMQLRKASGTLRGSGRPGGHFEASGGYDLTKKTGQLALTLADMNENGLRPFLASMFGERQLVSITVNATATAHYDTQGASALKGDFQLANLVVNEPQAKSNSPPLAAKFQVDASLNKQIAEVRQFEIALTPTPRAKNQLTLTGQVDMSKTNAIQGALKVVAESLDLTPYYDLLDNKKKSTNAVAAAPARAASPAKDSNTEPDAVKLPVQNLSLEINIGHLFVREMAISDWKTTAKIDGSHLLLNPCELAINGGPVKARVDFDLGVPGYRYDIIFSADKVPIAPLADSFSPNYAGHAKGELYADIQIKGEGVTGTNLKKTLAGQVSLNFTNANIQLVGPNAKLLMSALSKALILPELTQSPINWLSADAKITNGIINLTQVKAVSPGFAIGSQGTITIANVLKNSTINNLPIEMALPVAIARKANLAPANLNTNTTYVELGKVGTAGGTFDNFNASADYLAIGILTARAAPLGGDAAKFIRSGLNLGSILMGQATNRNNGATNQPATNQPARPNIFDLLPQGSPK